MTKLENKFKKCYQYIDNNFAKEEGKVAVVTGATGSIGETVSRYLLHLDIDVILACRSISKGNLLKEKLERDFPNRKIYLEIVDLESSESIDTFLNSISKYEHINYVFNVAGIFFISREDDNIETHFKVNCIGSIYLINGLLKIMEKGTIILVSSASYMFCSEQYEKGINLKSGKMMRRYAVSKRAETIEFINIKEKYESDDLHFNIVHPGATATSLFGKGWSKFAMRYIYPLFAALFPHVTKASLSILSGIQTTTRINEWIGPRGLFRLWGFPKKVRLHKNILKSKIRQNVSDLVVHFTNIYINK